MTKEERRQQSLIVSAIAFLTNQSINGNRWMWGMAEKWRKMFRYKTDFICETLYKMNGSIIQAQQNPIGYIQNALKDEFSKTQEPIYEKLDEIG